MAKASGYANYKKKGYGPFKRARDLPLPQTKNEITGFVEQSKGPVAEALFAEDLITYSEGGVIAVKPERVAQRAKDYVVETQLSAQTSKRSIIDAETRNLERLGVTGVTDKVAINSINRQEATKAKAILTAAQVGGVKLTEAQQERLRRAAGGRFLDLVYSQYESGERGTLQGVKQEHKQASFLNMAESAKEERAREFRENTRRYSGPGAGEKYGSFELGILRG